MMIDEEMNTTLSEESNVTAQSLAHHHHQQQQQQHQQQSESRQYNHHLQQQQQQQQQQFIQNHSSPSPSILTLQQHQQQPRPPPQAPPLPSNLFPLGTTATSSAVATSSTTDIHGNHQQIQLVPIGDLHMLDNLKNLFPNNNNNNIIRTISLNQLTGGNNISANGNILNGNEIITLNSSGNLVSSASFINNNSGNNNNNNKNSSSAEATTAAFKIVNSNFVANTAVTATAVNPASSLINPVSLTSSSSPATAATLHSQQQQIFSIDSNNTLTPIIIAATNNNNNNTGAVSSSTSNGVVTALLSNSSASGDMNVPPIQIEMSTAVGHNGHGSSSQLGDLSVNTSMDSSVTGSILLLQAHDSGLSLAANLDELSVNQLREECAKRKLPKNGVKQKLIDRLRNNTISSLQQHQMQMQQHLHNQQQLSGKGGESSSLLSSSSSSSQLSVNSLMRNPSAIVKSPDSGVNMDGSPSFISCKFTLLYNFFLSMPCHH
jgi:hypothetical protein